MEISFLLDTDSYKASHYLQYPKGTTSMFSYIESRGGTYKDTVFFGLQYYVKKYLTHRVTLEEVEFAKSFYEAHGVPFPYEGWKYIATELNGKLPVKIRAVDEGSVIPTHNALLTIESTDPKVFWVASWLETMLLRLWYPITVASRSFFLKKIFKEAIDKSSDNQDEIMFKLHDFGSRGVTSQESAMLGGAAHLVNFLGSDTVAGVLLASKYYNEPMAGFSIPASEHSSITSWGKDNEVEAYRNMLKQFGREGTVFACVSDSYDIYNACQNIWGGELKQEVIDSGATIVIRPDSGYPAQVVMDCLRILSEKFGYTLNSKGYKVLNNVRIIQGDGINDHSMNEIIDRVLYEKFSISNVAFGMGGGLLQQLDRDTQKFAMKCSQISIGNISVDVFKDPVTDPGKKSKRGRLDLIKDEDGIKTVTIRPDQDHHELTIMKTIFINGEIVHETNFKDIRKRSSASFTL